MRRNSGQPSSALRPPSGTSPRVVLPVCLAMTDLPFPNDGSNVSADCICAERTPPARTGPLQQRPGVGAARVIRAEVRSSPGYVTR
ncbi:hypothetical protein GCM10017771_68850 [Streptomyces capitiformicae]|uniref:Uncharacterized protein n=2 Tax=Streptomyces capitiformicae TaxID=2014920 RepID=A0A918ZEW4_9ACTN|nr:hypothetical protein GCM10017771_68850 [Streptomyces capitiformicae]